MAINFPDSPNVNDVHTESSLGKSWKWDGTTWLIYSSTTTGIALGDLSVSSQSASGGGSLTYNDTNGIFTYTPPALTTTFLGLNDTPNAFTSDKWLKVNSGGTALEWADAPSGGGGSYTLPTASTTVLGGVKIDASTITIDGNGVISVSSSVPTTITVANENVDIECFPLFTTAATGDLAPKTVTSFKLNSQSGQLEAGSFKKAGGSSSEFLKADGSIDSSTYSTFSGSYTDLSNKPTLFSGSYTDLSNKPTLVSNLSDLSDVDTTGATNGKIIKHNGTSWVIADDQSGGAGGGGGNVAVGSIMIWSGTVINIPTGWQLCDGTNGSPDLRDKFVIGAKQDDGNVAKTNVTGSLTQSGGSKDAVVVEHNHTTNIDGGGVFPGLGNSTLNYGGAGQYPYTSNFAINNEGVSGTNQNLPPYYALCYIYCTAAGSNQTFVGLSDTPSSHSNEKWLKSNGSALIWADAPSTPTLDAVLAAGNTSSTAATVGDFQCANLTVTGTTTTVNSNTVNIGDNILTLNSDETGTPSQNAGLEIERGTSTNVSLRWNETSDKWEFTNDGTNFSDISDNNTTYDLAAGASSGNATITLSGSDSTNDVVTLSGGGGTSFQVTGNTIQINSVNTIGALTDVNLGGGSPADDSILQYNSANTEWEVVSGSSVGASVPVGTIVMYNGDTAPSGWALCDGGGGRPDLRDKFVVGSGSSYSRGATGGYSDAIVVNHNHNAGTQSANHTHAPGNSMATNFTGDHYHQQSGSGSGTTGNQSVNHYHTIGSNKPDGSAGTWNVTTSGGAHTHQQYRNNYSVNTPYDAHGYGRSSSSTSVAQGVNTGSSNHSHTIDLTGVTTGGIDQNHTHNFNFNISGNTTYSSTGNHAHNINGNTGNESANHNHNINSEGSSGSGRNIPPYYAITFIIKT